MNENENEKKIMPILRQEIQLDEILNRLDEILKALKDRDNDTGG